MGTRLIRLNLLVFVPPIKMSKSAPALNDSHLFVLHLVFLPVIKNALDELLVDWNNHPLSSENNFSPNQLWHLGLTRYRSTHPQEFEELQDCDWDGFGIDYEGPVPGEEENHIIVPERPLPVNG